MEIGVREAEAEDWTTISTVIEKAFGKEEGPELVELVAALQKDETAQPLWALVAEAQGGIVGHVLFTSTRLKPEIVGERSAITAPLSVDPKCQRQGIGGRLIAHALEPLRQDGVQLVFVLGGPADYSRNEVVSAGVHGFEAHYPVPETCADA